MGRAGISITISFRLSQLGRARSASTAVGSLDGVLQSKGFQVAAQAAERTCTNRPMDTPNLKTINYRGGIVRFRIPDGWQEEYEDEGGGTFYAPGADTGTFRLYVTTFGAPPGKTLSLSDAPDFLLPFAEKYGVPIQSVRPGVAMIRYDLATSDRGQALKIRYWQVGQVLPPRNVRQALFSYTLLAKQFDQVRFHQEMDLLEREVLAAEFAPVLGQTGRRSHEAGDMN